MRSLAALNGSRGCPGWTGSRAHWSSGSRRKQTCLPRSHTSGPSPPRWVAARCSTIRPTARGLAQGSSTCSSVIRGASPLGLPHTRPRSPLRRPASASAKATADAPKRLRREGGPVAWLARNARSRCYALAVYEIASRPRLAVVIQRELVGMRAEPDRVEFLRPLPVDPGLDQIFGEDVALQQERVICFERVDGLFERAWGGPDADFVHLVTRHLVDVAIERVAWVCLVLVAVDHRDQHRRPRQVAVAARVRAAELEALGLRALRVHRNADGRRPVARRER